eukprot:scaffold43901_cov52-Attheya_sp.AAC.4
MSKYKAEQLQKDAASRLSHSFVMQTDENVANEARNRVLYARTPPNSSSKHVDSFVMQTDENVANQARNNRVLYARTPPNSNNKIVDSLVMQNDENVMNEARNHVLYARTPNSSSSSSSKHVDVPCIVSPPPVPTRVPTNSPDQHGEYHSADRRDYYSMGNSHAKQEQGPPYSGYHYPPSRTGYPLMENGQHEPPRDHHHSHRDDYSPNHVGNHFSPPSYYSSRDYNERPNETFHDPNGFYSRIYRQEPERPGTVGSSLMDPRYPVCWANWAREASPLTTNWPVTVFFHMGKPSTSWHTFGPAYLNPLGEHST